MFLTWRLFSQYLSVLCFHCYIPEVRGHTYIDKPMLESPRDAGTDTNKTKQCSSCPSYKCIPPRFSVWELSVPILCPLKMNSIMSAVTWFVTYDFLVWHSLKTGLAHIWVWENLSICFLSKENTEACVKSIFSFLSQGSGTLRTTEAGKHLQPSPLSTSHALVT